MHAKYAKIYLNIYMRQIEIYKVKELNEYNNRQIKYDNRIEGQVL